MLIEVQSIPGCMFLQELKQNVAQHVEFRNFFAQPKMQAYNQFEEQKKLEENNQAGDRRRQKHVDTEKGERYERQQYQNAYFEPVDIAAATRFVDEFNARQFSYKSKVRTTNYKRYQSEMWQVRLVNKSFDQVYASKTSREEERNNILQKEIGEATRMHHEFLARLLEEKIDGCMETKEDFLKNCPQRPVLSAKVGECAFWDKL